MNKLSTSILKKTIEKNGFVGDYKRIKKIKNENNNIVRIFEKNGEFVRIISDENDINVIELKKVEYFDSERLLNELKTYVTNNNFKSVFFFKDNYDKNIKTHNFSYHIKFKTVCINENLSREYYIDLKIKMTPDCCTFLEFGFETTNMENILETLKPISEFFRNRFENIEVGQYKPISEKKEGKNNSQNIIKNYKNNFKRIGIPKENLEPTVKIFIDKNNISINQPQLILEIFNENDLKKLTDINLNEIVKEKIIKFEEIKENMYLYDFNSNEITFVDKNRFNYMKKYKYDSFYTYFVFIGKNMNEVLITSQSEPEVFTYNSFLKSEQYEDVLEDLNNDNNVEEINNFFKKCNYFIYSK